MRRLVAPTLVLLSGLVLVSILTVGPSEPTLSPSTEDRSAPVVRLHRGSAPVRIRQPVPVPIPAPAPAPAPDRPTSTPDLAADDPVAPPRALTLEDLEPEVREALGQAAMDHLHELAEACAGTVAEPQDLGAFVTLDPSGVVELELRPIGSEPGPIRVEDRDLPDELVDCLDDTLWAQDWSATVSALPDGAELPIALTMRLDR